MRSESRLRPFRLAALLLASAVVSALLPVSAEAAQAPSARPNILWLTAEDMGPELGCYGDEYADTPSLDELARQGLRYRVAWSNAPVCAPARTAIITGVYPTSTGAEHMRSEVRLPDFMRLYPQFLREAGYYCTNNSKTDYNLVERGRAWDESSGRAHWTNRKEGQPFFAIFNSTNSHESQVRRRPHTLTHDPAKAPIPKYHPDTPEVRRDWAQYYDNITTIDAEAGARLAELREAGLADDTIVFFYGDHGAGMPRSKRWPHNSGLHVAMIVYVPEKFRHLAPADYEPGGMSERLVSFVDLAPTLLSLVGTQPPDWMQGHAFMGPHAAEPQPYVYGFRGRMDERYDLVRSVRNQRYVYIRNFMPHLIYGQHIGYMFEMPTTQVWKRLFDEGKLNEAQQVFWKPKAPVELYDLENDPDEIHNLAGSAEHREVERELEQALRTHLLRTRDVGLLSEAEMHRRAGETTIYEFGQDESRYPLERVLSAAETASGLDPQKTPELIRYLSDSDSGVRYWGVMGLLMRGADAVAAGRSQLSAALKDESPTVRIVAAHALGEHGNPSELEAALATLRELAPPDKNGAYASVLTLTVIDALGPKAEPLLDMVRTMPTQDPSVPSRPNGYVSRLVQTLTGAPRD